MTFENTCRNCPYAQYVGNILFRSCSISQEKGDIYIECSMRPELGFFEPSIRFDYAKSISTEDLYNYSDYTYSAMLKVRF